MFKLTRRKVVIFAVLLLLVLGVSYLLISRQNKTPPVTTLTGAEYKGLTPGKSSREELLNSLGNPVKETQDGNTRTLEYLSRNPNYNNQFLTTGNTLSFIKTYITPDDNLSITDIEKKYGENQQVLYGSGSISGFDLYVYPDKGVAYIGNKQTDDVLEVWYFSPTDFENFQSLYAADYSTSPNTAPHY